MSLQGKTVAIGSLPMRNQRKILFLIAMVGLLPACSSKMKMQGRPMPVMADSAGSDHFESEADEPVEYAEEAQDMSDDSELVSSSPMQSSELAQPVKVQTRKVFYNGDIKLELASPQEIISTLIEDVEKLGGYVEKRSLSTVTLRVPVKKFQLVFDDVLKRGVVLEKSIEARDITREFQDLELRKKFMKASLDKFYALLKSAKSASEKIAILREITQLKERLRSMEARLAQLDNMAKFSKLAVAAVGRNRQPAGIGGHQVRAFRWLDALSPNSRGLAIRNSKVEPPLPAQFVEVDKRRHWESQTTGKSSFWAYRLKNELEASSEFWIQTMSHKLKTRFDKLDGYTKGKVKGLRFEDGVGERYSYHIQVIATEDYIYMFEASFPNLDEERKHIDHVSKSVANYAAGVEDDI